MHFRANGSVPTPSPDESVIIITGGAGAVGRACAKAFAAQGRGIVIVDRTEELALAAAEDIGKPGYSLGLGCDLRTLEGAQKMVQMTMDNMGRIDGIVHAIGGFAMGPISDASEGDYDRLFDLNMRTLFNTARAAMPALRETRSGFLTAFAAAPALVGSGPNMGLYAASKSALVTFMHSLDAELTDTELRVFVTTPMGIIDTPANREAMPGGDATQWICPAKIAEAVSFAAFGDPRARIGDLTIHPPRGPAA